MHNNKLNQSSPSQLLEAPETENNHSQHRGLPVNMRGRPILITLVYMGAFWFGLLTGCTPTCEEMPDQPRCVMMEPDPEPDPEIIIGGADGGDIIIRDGLTLDDGDTLEPRTIDLLIMAPIDQSPVSDFYDKLIDTTVVQLARYQLIVQHAAIAPMYRRLNQSVPLLYGLPDDEAEFDSLADALTYFTSEEGLSNLSDDGVRDGENLLQLGARLGTAAVHHPFTPVGQGEYLFREPEDGILVLWINPFSRRCVLGDCLNTGETLVEKLTELDENDQAAWLSMGGQQRLPLKRIVHGFIATEETSNYSTFLSRCQNRTGLPSGVLDYIENSPSPLYSSLQEELRAQGSPSSMVDFCAAISDQGEEALEQIAIIARRAIR